MKFLANNKSFTLIELLIVIGILAVLAVVVIFVLNPLEFTKQTRDARRLSDLQTIHRAISYYRTGGGTSFGSSSPALFMSLFLILRQIALI